MNKMLHVSFPHSSHTLQELHLFQIQLQKDILDALEKPWMPGTVIPVTTGQTQFSKLVHHFLLLHFFSTLCCSFLLLVAYFNVVLLMVALVIVTLNH